jgi:hypothetical protein
VKLEAQSSRDPTLDSSRLALYALNADSYCSTRRWQRFVTAASEDSAEGSGSLSLNVRPVCRVLGSWLLHNEGLHKDKALARKKINSK